MGYILIGLIWSAFLEYYTGKYFVGAMGAPFIWRERLFHITLWPITLSYFIYTFFKYKDNE